MSVIDYYDHITVYIPPAETITELIVTDLDTSYNILFQIQENTTNIDRSNSFYVQGHISPGTIGENILTQPLNGGYPDGSGNNYAMCFYIDGNVNTNVRLFYKLEGSTGFRYLFPNNASLSTAVNEWSSDQTNAKQSTETYRRGIPY